jgi:cell shape-determining protein MreC
MITTNSKRKIAILLGLSAILFLADSLGLLSGVHYYFEKNKSELQSGLFKKSHQGKESKNRELSRQLAACQLRVLELAEENRASRRLLEADLPVDLDYQTAHLLGKSSGWVELDVGEKQGVSIDAAVLAGGVLIGRIARASGNISWVRLLTSQDSREIVGIWRNKEEIKKGESAMVKGLLVGGESLMVKEILAHEEVEEGDLVASNRPPARFLIGRVEKVWISENGLYKKVLVKPFGDLDNLSSVFVVKVKR